MQLQQPNNALIKIRKPVQQYCCSIHRSKFEAWLTNHVTTRQKIQNSRRIVYNHEVRVTRLAKLGYIFKPTAKATPTDANRRITNSLPAQSRKPEPHDRRIGTWRCVRSPVTGSLRVRDASRSLRKGARYRDGLGKVCARNACLLHEVTREMPFSTCPPVSMKYETCDPGVYMVEPPPRPLGISNRTGLVRQPSQRWRFVPKLIAEKSLFYMFHPYRITHRLLPVQANVGASRNFPRLGTVAERMAYAQGTLRWPAKTGRWGVGEVRHGGTVQHLLTHALFMEDKH